MQETLVVAGAGLKGDVERVVEKVEKGVQQAESVSFIYVESI